MLYQICILFLTIIMYMAPLVIFLPFKLSIFNKGCLFLHLAFYIILGTFFLGNWTILLMLLSVSIHLAFIEKYALRNICLFICSYLTNVLMANLQSVLLWICFNITVQDLNRFPLLNCSLLLIHILSVCIICKLLVYLFRELEAYIPFSVLSSKVISFILLCLLMLLILFATNIIAGEKVGYSPLVVAFNTFIFFVFFLITTGIIIYSIRIYKEESETKLKQSSFEALQEYTNQVETLYNNLRSFKHDYMNILSTMYIYIDSHDMEGLSEYFQEHIIPLSKQLAPENYQISRLANLNLLELKSLITAKLIYAQELKIETTIEIESPVKKVNVDIIDLSRILGIFLDNSIEAALQTASPKLSFTIINTEDETLFIITNNFIDNHISFNEISNLGYSTKGANRGMGLYNARKLISKYNNLYLDMYIENDIWVQALHIYNQ